MRKTRAAVTLTILAAATACGGHTTPAAPPPVTTATTTPRTTSAVPTTSASPTDAGCSNLTLTDAVRAQLAAADGRPGAALPAGLGAYYGMCGATAYAWTHFTAAAAATLQEKVAFQDDGLAYELLARENGAWKVLAHASSVEAGSTCTTQQALPSALKNLWHGCGSGGGAGSTVLSSCESYFGARSYLEPTTVAVRADGSATVTGTPLTVHCGGPDDYQFVPGAGTRTVTLVPGATVSVVALPGPVDRTIPVRALAAYLAGTPESGDFEVGGPASAATSLSEQFRP